MGLAFEGPKGLLNRICSRDRVIHWILPNGYYTPPPQLLLSSDWYLEILCFSEQQVNLLQIIKGENGVACAVARLQPKLARIVARLQPKLARMQPELARIFV